MITLTVEAILVILLVLVLMQFFKKKPAPAAAPVAQPDLANLKPADARAGDVISVSGAGDNFEDLDFTVDRCVFIQAGAHRWTDLSGPYRERRVVLRAGTNSDGDSEVALHSEKQKLTLEDVGVAENDLADMDERQNTADWFEYNGKAWAYRLSREVQASGDSNSRAYYYWEFQERDGPGLLAIRKEEGEPFSVTMFKRIPAGDVTVYRGGRT